MSRFSLDGKLGKLMVRGARLHGNIAEAVTAAKVTMTTTEVSQLDLTLVDDADMSIARGGLFDAGTPSTAGSRISWNGNEFECRAVEIFPVGAGITLQVTGRDLGASRMRRRKGADLKRMSPTDWLAGEAKACGLKFVGQPSAPRKNVGRHKNENTWTAGVRLGTELGYDFFVAAQTVYFGKPTWLIQHTKVLPVAWKGAKTDDSIDSMPRCRRSGDDAKKLATVQAALRRDLGEQAVPGMLLRLTGVPNFDGDYMVNQVSVGLADHQPANVSAETPINPKPQPPIKAAGGGGSHGDPSGGDGGDSGSGSTSTARGTAGAFVAAARSQLGKPYVYGAEASVSDPSPTAFDCSELVQWAAGRAGVAFVDGSSAQYAASIKISVDEAIHTYGAILHHEGHIAISLGNGMTIEAANPSVGVVSYPAAGRFTGGGKIPGLRY